MKISKEPGKLEDSIIVMEVNNNKKFYNYKKNNY